MANKRGILITLLVVWFGSFCYSQELQVRVTINASRINSTVDKKIFNTLQSQLANFLNSRKWTNDQFGENEKVQCNFLVNLESIVEPNVYKATLMIQAARPVYNASYQTALMNFQDPDFTFKYIEYQPIDFSDNRVQGTDASVANLTAVFAYYAYIILGLDYDSFTPKGGDALYQKALNIVNNAPEGSNISGWRAFDGLRNRYWLVENLTNTRNNIVHDVIYTYCRAGLDKMYDNENDARAGILQSLTQLESFNRENQNTMIVQFFMQSKMLELIGIFKKAGMEDKNKVLELLSDLDAANTGRYKDELK
jgi:hypothetical protein